MKTCFKCHTRKPLSEFYKHSQMGDGYLGKCKTCTKSDVKKNRVARHDQYKEYERQRATTPNRIATNQRYRNTAAGKVSVARSHAKWLRENADKRAAHVILGNAVRDGRIQKKPCEVCGSIKRIHGHHDDYGKPLNVRWLCPKHHAETHRRP